MADEVKIPISLPGAAKAAQDAGQVASGLGKINSAATQAGAATAATAGGAATAAKSLGDLRTAGTGAAQVFSGLQQASHGGIGALFGITNAVRGFINVIRTGVVSSGPIGLLLVALGTLAGLFLALTRRTKETAAGFTEASQQSDVLKKRLGELEKDSKQSLEEQLGHVKNLAAGYRDLVSLMDEASSRTKRLRQSQAALALAQLAEREASALAAAKTPEETASIRAQFGRERTGMQRNTASTELEAERLEAKNRIRVAEEQLASAREARRAAEVTARTAADVALDAKAVATTATKDALTTAQILGGKSLTGEDPEVLQRFKVAKDANTEAIIAAKKAADAQANLAKVTLETAAAVAQATRDIKAAELALELGQIQSQTLGSNQRAEDLTALAEAKPKIEGLKKEAARAMEAQDFGGQDRANAERRALEASLKPIEATVTQASGGGAAVLRRAGDMVVTAIERQTDSAMQTMSQVAAAAEKSQQQWDLTSRQLKNRLDR